MSETVGEAVVSHGKVQVFLNGVSWVDDKSNWRHRDHCCLVFTLSFLYLSNLSGCVAILFHFFLSLVVVLRAHDLELLVFKIVFEF